MENEIVVNEAKVPTKGLIIAGVASAAVGLGFGAFMLIKKLIVPAIQKRKEDEEYVCIDDNDDEYVK